MYYDPNQTLSKQRLFNFVIGARGCGKTYGAKKTVIRNFIRKGEQFVYLRRYDTEMPSAEMRNFFDDISVEFPDVEFKAWNGLFRINNEIAGWYFPLSKATMLKSIPFPNVSLIIFDEFIIEVGVYRYLPNEVNTFLECYSTISRDRDIPVLFLSNAITMTNPYFIYFNITFEHNQVTKLYKHISVELIQNHEYTEHVQSTKFGELISGTAYGEYNMKNKFLLDTDTFLDSLPVGAGYMCTFQIQGKKFGYYTSAETGLRYLSDKIDTTAKRIFALDFKDHNDATVLLKSRNPYVVSLIDAYCSGLLRFTTQETKNIATDILRKLI